MSADTFKQIRMKALEAVQDMPDGELKTKAFEVFLQHLLALESSPRTADRISSSPSGQAKVDKSKQPGSTKSRILLVKDEGFFAVPRSITEIRSELRAHGWILPVTSLSGPLQQLVQSRELRRIKEQGTKQKVWKYVNP